MRSTTWNCRRGSPAGRLTRTQPQALGRGPCLPAQHPVPRRRRCPHPAISAGPAWTRRLASGQSGRRAARQGSGVSPASTEPSLLPPSMTSVSPAPARSGPAAREMAGAGPANRAAPAISQPAPPRRLVRAAHSAGLVSRIQAARRTHAQQGRMPPEPETPANRAGTGTLCGGSATAGRSPARAGTTSLPASAGSA